MLDLGELVAGHEIKGRPANGGGEWYCRCGFHIDEQWLDESYDWNGEGIVKLPAGYFDSAEIHIARAVLAALSPED